MDHAFDRSLLRQSAALLLVGQLLYVIVTLLHTGGEANDHPDIFAAYANSASWTAVHVAQFGCVAVMLAGLLGLFTALDRHTGVSRLANRFGAASTTATLALYGGVLAVDGVALQKTVQAWVSAPEMERAARFADAEAMRWLEWGMRSYENFMLGVAVLMAAVVVRKAHLPQTIAYLMALASFTYFLQGWLAGAQGFSSAHESAIIAAELLNVVWMTWLLFAAGKTRIP